MASPSASTSVRAATAPAPTPPVAPRRRAWVAWAAVGVAVAAGLVLRFTARSPLWLDEALSVNIARLPVGALLEALRHDGHPPLYYLVLHGWMRLVGEGDAAVRALSGLAAVAALPLAWLVGRRLGGRPTAVAGLVLLSTSPFAVRYATETRMYALVVLLVLAGWLALDAALARPSPPRLAAVAAVSGLLLLSHYWAFYLLGAVGAVLLAAAWRGRRPSAARRALVAVAAGGLAFLPWLPSFLAQMGDTGTPWGRPARPTTVVAVTLDDFGGGPFGEAQVLGLLLALAVVLGVLGRAVDRRRIELDLWTRPEARPAAAVVAGTLGLGVLGGYITAGAYATRYAAVVFPLVVLLAGLGTARLASPPVRVGALAVLALLGLVGGVRNAVTDRTQASEIATALEAGWAPGDVVAYCPDQLGPAVSRELDVPADQRTYPDGARPERVDWVDYAERMAAADPRAFAADLLDDVPTSTVWVVWAPGYRTVEEACDTVIDTLVRARPGGGPVVASGHEFEHAWLHRFPAP